MSCHACCTFSSTIAAERMGDTNSFMTAEIYICLQNLPFLPINLKQGAICPNIALHLYNTSISENILVLDGLYLNNLNCQGNLFKKTSQKRTKPLLIYTVFIPETSTFLSFGLKFYLDFLNTGDTIVFISLKRK